MMIYQRAMSSSSDWPDLPFGGGKMLRPPLALGKLSYFSASYSQFVSGIFQW
jgi:hypothetical protein